MTHEWVWVALDVAVAAHGEQLAEHGGGEGVRDVGMLESAMARPRSLLAYGDPPHLDAATEQQVNVAISGMGLTRIIIAHRAETIRAAQRTYRTLGGKLHELSEQDLRP